MFDRKDLEVVSRAYREGKAEGGLKGAHQRARGALLGRHPELCGLGEEAVTLRVAQVLSTALITGYLSQA
jgi:hypothetical protein